VNIFSYLLQSSPNLTLDSLSNVQGSDLMKLSFEVRSNEGGHVGIAIEVLS